MNKEEIKDILSHQYLFGEGKPVTRVNGKILVVEDPCEHDYPCKPFVVNYVKTTYIWFD